MKNFFQKKIDKKIFSKFEIKYIVSKKLSETIQNKIKKFMRLDKQIEDSEKGYFVRSLYFDNRLNSNFNEKVDGLLFRHKFRLRTYSEKFDKKSIFFLEKKGQYNSRTFKIRKKIQSEDLQKYLDIKKNTVFLQKSKNKLVNEFIFDSFRKKLKPIVVIDYYRKPYINKSGIYFRLTFDSNIKANKNKNLFDFSNEFKESISGYEIIEVKFDRTIPIWFQKIIQSFELKRLSVSKFVLGCETTNIAYDYEGR